MASRRSRRKKKGGGKGKFIAALVVIAAAGIGGWMYLNGGDKGSDSTESSIADLIPGLDDTDETPDQPKGDSQSLAQVEALLADINTNLAVAEADEREKALRNGYDRLSKLLENPLPIEERARALELFHSVTDELFMSSVHNEFSENYVVKGGDSFDRIARKHKVSTNLLYDLNGRPRGSTNLHPGDNLKVPKGEPKVVVRKGDYTTSIYLGSYLVRQYIVAHGKNDNTPLGVSKIASMTIDPEKSSRGANDPVNEMKLRWIGLETYGGNRSGIGFHGTQYPDSIPGMTSRGCIRMHDDDVVELYDIVRIGNKVEVKS